MKADPDNFCPLLYENVWLGFISEASFNLGYFQIHLETLTTFLLVGKESILAIDLGISLNPVVFSFEGDHPVDRWPQKINRVFFHFDFIFLSK